jgi:hypothetical protein
MQLPSGDDLVVSCIAMVVITAIVCITVLFALDKLPIC